MALCLMIRGLKARQRITPMSGRIIARAAAPPSDRASFFVSLSGVRVSASNAPVSIERFAAHRA